MDIIDFMPLASVNYSGGIIISDWYSSNNNPDESIKITIRFLTNEIRSDALDINVFNRKCLDMNLLNCKVIQTDGAISAELKKEILRKAAIYKDENKKERQKIKINNHFIGLIKCNQINQYFVERYNFKSIENKWQKIWEENKSFHQ